MLSCPQFLFLKGKGGEAEGLMQGDNDDEYLHTEFYLTRARNREEFNEAGIKPELQVKIISITILFG